MGQRRYFSGVSIPGTTSLVRKALYRKGESIPGRDVSCSFTAMQAVHCTTLKRAVHMDPSNPKEEKERKAYCQVLFVTYIDLQFISYNDSG